MASAAQLFAGRGYLGTSMRDVAAASGVREPSIYSHFESKEALLVEAIRPYLEAFLSRLQKASEPPGLAAETLERMLITSVEVGTEHRYSFLAMSNNWEWIERNPELEVLRNDRDAAFHLWRRTFARGLTDGTLRRVEVHDALWIISSAITGMIDRRYAAGPADAPPTATLVSILVEGLAPRSDARQRER